MISSQAKLDNLSKALNRKSNEHHLQALLLVGMIAHPLGRQVMLVWRKACIDYQQWFKLKHTSGIYIAIREKSYSTTEICAINLSDRTEPRNVGIASDQIISGWSQSSHGKNFLSFERNFITFEFSSRCQIRRFIERTSPISFC